MWEKIRVVFTIPELRKKILLHARCCWPIYRVGWQIPLPIVDQAQMTAVREQCRAASADLLEQVAVFSASQLSQVTIFGLGIMPYISASIIFQLLGQRLGAARAAAEGRRKRAARRSTNTRAMPRSCFAWGKAGSISSFLTAVRPGASELRRSGDGQHLTFRWQIVAVLTMTAGTMFLMWLGEQIDEFGIGNGISLLIMAGILGRHAGRRHAAASADRRCRAGGGGGKLGIETLIVLVVLFVAVVAGVVFITLGQRRIPTQSAKHVRGRRVYGGTRQYLPLQGQSGGRDADHFRQQLADVPADAVQLAGSAQYPGSHVAAAVCTTRSRAARRSSTTCCTSR